MFQEKIDILYTSPSEEIHNDTGENLIRTAIDETTDEETASKI